MSVGRVVAACGVGVGAAWLVGRRGQVSSGEAVKPIGEALEPWEREALAAGHVGLPEGNEVGFDEPPVGRGSPDEYCVGVRSLQGSAGDEPEPHCVLNPLTDPRFAPVDRGAPPSSVPSLSVWPVQTSHPSRLVLSYWTAGGVRGYSGRAFAAKRVDSRGERNHAGVDLFAREGDLVVAPEDGRVLAILPFNAGTWAVYLRSVLDDRVVNLGEVEKLSWREFGVTPGRAVKLGQPLARIGRQTRGSTMLHLETYGVDAIADELVVESIRAGVLRWLGGEAAPAWLRDPTAYLLEAARRSHQRESLPG